METQTEIPLSLVIEELILADLRHCQLIFGLEALGLAPLDNHFLGLSKLIASWMGYKTDEELDAFYEIYQSFMGKSTSVPVSDQGLELKPIASKCYLALNDKVQNLGLRRLSTTDFSRLKMGKHETNHQNNG